MKAAPYIAAAVGSIALISAAYAVMTRAEYLVSGDQVRAIIVSEESVERMEFQLEYKLSELRRYEAIPENQRTSSDLVQIDELREQIEQLRTRLKKARGY